MFRANISILAHRRRTDSLIIGHDHTRRCRSIRAGRPQPGWPGQVKSFENKLHSGANKQRNGWQLPCATGGLHHQAPACCIAMALPGLLVGARHPAGQGPLDVPARLPGQARILPGSRAPGQAAESPMIMIGEDRVKVMMSRAIPGLTQSYLLGQSRCMPPIQTRMLMPTESASHEA